MLESIWPQMYMVTIYILIGIVELHSFYCYCSQQILQSCMYNGFCIASSHTIPSARNKALPSSQIVLHHNAGKEMSKGVVHLAFWLAALSWTGIVVISTVVPHPLWVLTLLTKWDSVFHWAILHFKSFYYYSWLPSISSHHPTFVTNVHINRGKEISKAVVHLAIW